MTILKRTCLACTTLGLLILTQPASAQDQSNIWAKENWQIRVRAIDVIPDVDSSVNIGGEVDADNAVVPELDISYFFTDHIAAELILATLKKNPATLTVVNSNSPLRLDIPMGEGLCAMARAGQPVAMTPFTVSGAMSPVTIAGALAQQNAEALALITLSQIVSAGTPVLYGGFTSNVDMRSGAPAFGTPEYAKAQLASGQLAIRRDNIPFPSSNVTGSNCVDVQASYESGMSLWSTIMGGVHLIEHAAGWLEGGLTASFEKLILTLTKESTGL